MKRSFILPLLSLCSISMLYFYGSAHAAYSGVCFYNDSSYYSIDPVVKAEWFGGGATCSINEVNHIRGIHPGQHACMNFPSFWTKDYRRPNLSFYTHYASGPCVKPFSMLKGNNQINVHIVIGEGATCRVDL